MKNLIKKLFMFTSILGVAVAVSGCCAKKTQKVTATETTVFYQTYEEADVNRVHAKMYTRSSHGGESRISYLRKN